jgi:hypothetical protein
VTQTLCFFAALSSSGSDAPAELVWTNLPASWGVFVFLAAVTAVVYAVFALYRRELTSCPNWAKSVLAALRAASILVLVTILLGPAIVHVQERTLEPTLVLLRDASQSMNTVDVKSAANASRAQVVNDLFDSKNLRLTERLSKKGRIAVLDFAGQANVLDRPRPLVPDGRATDLTAAIQAALAIDRTSAIVVFTDGQHTGPDDPRAIAREAGARRVPLFLVGIGETTRRQNVSVLNVTSVPRAWQGEPFEIDATLQFQGLESGDVLVELVEHPLNDQQPTEAPRPPSGRVVQSQRVPAPKSARGQSRIAFTHTATADGAYQYQVRVEPAAADTQPDDNLASSSVVRVQSREQIRVLLVAGSPTWDYRLVQKLLAREETIALSCWLQSLDEGRAQDGTLPVSQLPRAKEELFKYDLVLLLDPDPRELDAAWVELLSQFVGEHGGGLLFMAGSKHTGQLLTGSKTAAVAHLLPVTFGDLQARQVDALLATTQRPWPMKVVPASGDHPLLRFFPDREQTVRQWESLPGVFWSFPCEGAKPTAQVLLAHGDPTLRGPAGGRPLLVAGRFGAGQTVYLGLEGTWRWRTAGKQAEFFDKFWLQAVRYLVEGRTNEGRRRGIIQPDRDRYEIGEQIVLKARLLDEAYEPLSAPSVEAALTQSGQPDETITLLPVPDRPGEFEGATTARRTGSHEVALKANASAAVAAPASFHVELPSAESSQVWLNKPLLQELASLSGGRYFDVDQVDELPPAVPDRTETIEIRTPPEPLWDTSGVLALLVGLVCTEWLLRKRFQLL